MSTQYTMWVHGSGVQVQDPSPLIGIRRTGSCCLIKMPSFHNAWFHFAVPTPSVISNAHVRIIQVWLEFDSTQGHYISSVRAFHGHYPVAIHKDLRLEGGRAREMFDVQEKVKVETGICVSVRVSSPDHATYSHPIYLRFFGTGATFETI